MSDPPPGSRVEPAAADAKASAGAARIAWFATLGSLNTRDRPTLAPRLPAPAGVRAVRGRGQVTVSWSPVDGAAGYLVHRATAADGRLRPVDQGGGDVLAVPHAPYLDTTGSDSAAEWYSVAALPTVDADGPELSRPVRAERGPADGRVAVNADASEVRGPLRRPWRPMIGSEHLALLLGGPGPGGHDVGQELADALRIARRELGVDAVRAHAILDDSLGLCTLVDGQLVLDFRRLDLVVDAVLETGLRPVVELSFMPAALASDPHATVFAYGGIISPPRDHDRWAALVRSLVAHLADRYGRAAVREWSFEVWNEPNLRLFWAGAESDYLRLYEVTARAVKSVDGRFLVGGPATAAASWVDDLLAYCDARDVPLDFLSTHTYGLPPLDLRPLAARFGRPDLPLWWTEWGVSPTHAGAINDSVWGAPLVARGMRSAAGRIDALSYWVVSDHFVELGEAPSLFHGGFGLLTIGNLRKPRFWALAVLERLGAEEVGCAVEGDGGGSLVEAWATRDPDGRVAVAMWNGTIDPRRAAGDPALDRAVTLTVDGLDRDLRYELRHHRVDREHSNIVRAWEALGRPTWPDEAGWARLRAADRLEALNAPAPAPVVQGRIELAFDLPMPSLSLIELVPVA